jgi:hypothetical protein
VQVVVKHPAQCPVLFFAGVVGAGLVGGVGAQQVVEGIAAGGVLGQQVSGGQFVQGGAGLLAANSGEAVRCPPVFGQGSNRISPGKGRGNVGGTEKVQSGI